MSSTDAEIPTVEPGEGEVAKPKRTRKRKAETTAEVVAEAANAEAEDAPAPKPKRTRRPRKSQEERERDEQRAAFTRGMETWLRSMKYQVGIPEMGLADIGEGKAGEMASKAIEVAKTLAGVAVPMMASSGGSSEELFYTLVPLLPLADLLGFQVKAGTPMLVPVIFADGLTSDEVYGRFEQFFELGEPLSRFGLKLNGQATGPAAIYPLVVYFDPQRFAQDVATLLPKSHFKRVMHMVAVDAGYISVTERKVTWRKTDGFLMGLAKGLSKMMGQKYPIFDDRDLNAVLTLAAIG